MRGLVATTLALSMISGGAHATGGIECSDPDGRASISMTIGSLPILAVVGAQISAGDRQWSMGGKDDSAIIAGQAFQAPGEMRVDFTDPNVERVVAELRLFSSSEAKDYALAGTLRIADVGAYPVVCVGP